MSEVAEQQINALAGVNVLLIGPSGTGKTHSIGTLVDAGIEVFYIALENGLESLLGYYTDRGLPIPENLHWHTVKAPTAGFAEMISGAKNVNVMSLEALSKMQDTNRAKYNQFVSLLEALNNFKDDRTGKEFGPVDSWDTTRAVVIDGMAGVNRCAMSLVVGGKPVRNQADWQVAQNITENLLRKLCDDVKAHFIILAHVERETDQVLGGVKLMVASLGRALAPKIPAMFSDVILAVRTADKWTWDTANAMADVKTRNLPISSTNAPTFANVIAKWKSRGGAA